MSPHPKSRLIYKFLAVLLPFIFLSISGTALVLTYTNYRYLDQTIRRDYENIISRSAGEIRLFVNSSKEHLQSLGLIMATASLDAWEKEMAITAFLHQNAEFAFVDLVSPDGRPVIQTVLSQNPEGGLPQELLDRARSGKTAVSGVMRSEEGLPFTQLAVPVMKHGTVAEILHAHLDLKAIWNVLEGIDIGESGQVYILDLSGKYLGHRKMDRVVRSPPAEKPDILEAFQKQPGTTVEWIESREGVDSYHVGAQVKDYGWVVVLSQPVSEIYVFLYRNLFYAALLTVGICAAALLFGWFWVRRRLAPVHALHRQVQSIGGGDLDRKVTVKTDDEIGELGREFNRMTESLKAHIEREVESARALVHAKNLAMLGTTSSKVAHEIGNFLSNADMAVSTLKRESLSLSPRAEKVLGILERESTRAKTFIRNYLRFAKKPELHLQRRPLGLLIREAVSVLQEAAEQAGVSIEVEWSENELPVNVDAGLINQMAHNLIKNAIDAMPGGGTLKIAGKMNADEVAIVFSDTGAGIAEDDLATIFEPFFTTKSEGSGLGLPIVKNIAEAHQGSVACRSTPGEGTTFEIRLPISQAPSSESA